MNITSSYQVRIVNCSVNLIDTVRIYQEALSYLIGIVNDNWDAVRSITTGALEQRRYIEKLVHGNKTVNSNIRNSIKSSISILRTCAVQPLQLLSVQRAVPAVILLIGKTPTSIRYTYVSCGGSRLPDTRGVTGKNI